MSKQNPNLAFAGVGWIGRHRMKAVIDAGTAQVALIADPSEQCISEALKICNARVSPSFADLLKEPQIDGVVIATPSALHKEQAVAAFESGKAVFCQKPLGRNAAEVKAVIDASKKAGKLLGADFSYRYTAAFQKILPVIRSGELGNIYAVDLKFHNAYGPDKPWFYDIKQAGGGCVLDLGIHLIDLMLYALDFPKVDKVSSHLFSKGLQVNALDTVEDFADVSMMLSNQATVHLSCSWNLQAGCEAVIEASFYGTKGGVAIKNINGSFYDFAAYRYYGTKLELLVQPPDEWGGRAIVNWASQLAIDNSYQSSAEEFLYSAGVLDAIYERV